MDVLIPIIASIIVSLISLVGIAFLYFKTLEKTLKYLVAFAAGALLGGAFFHLIAEASDLQTEKNFIEIGVNIIGGFIVFLLIEKFLYWHHCHEKKNCMHHISYMNLIGDFVHNFLDGIAIGISFGISLYTGIATTLAIALHEIPQEIGDMAILIHFGLKKTKAIILNFLVSLSAIIGAIVGFYLSDVEMISRYLMAFSAGGFIFIATTDLIPEMKKEESKKESIILLIVFAIGIIVLYLAKILFE